MFASQPRGLLETGAPGSAEVFGALRGPFGQASPASSRISNSGVLKSLLDGFYYNIVDLINT